ncbi:MAG: 1-deoxy-D-xylulose-5-phosphate synthase [Candidatus Obscuribacterales bacterium]
MHTLVQRQPSFLDAICSPSELKKLTAEQLVDLASEIRQEIVQNLNKTGGHLASNLGIVEITLALHYVFNTPQDQILWDVGHQAYVHKMLTGRRHKFGTLRQFKGLSGFISPAESDYDAFVAGHSSTSVSLAVGMALARDHLKKDHKVIALIGDGGLTGGMALEALNHLGHIQRDVLIVLNDNDMSISENLGGFSQYMKRIKETFFYRDIKEKIDLIEDRLDELSLDPKLWSLITSVKQEAKERIVTPGIVFEKLGINYSGPVDGHDVGAVIEALESVKGEKRPHLLHLITRKGKGYEPAENDSIKYHGVKAYSLEPVLREKTPDKKKSLTYSHVFTDSLIDLAEKDPDLVAITPATAEGSGLVKFSKVYPERFFDVAICEQHAVTMAAGMAKSGLKPVVSIYSTFLQRAMDQVIHDVAIMNLPVIFGVDRGGLVEDGETHQGVFDIAYLRSIPNFTVLAPRDARELRNMLYSAIRENRGPVAVRFPRDTAVGADAMAVGPDAFETIDFRKWETLVEGSSPLTILAFGSMVQTALDMLPALKAIGLAPSVVNARCAKPLDEKLLEELLGDPAGHVITLEEGCLSGGFGAAVMEWAAGAQMRSPQAKLARVLPVALPDRFIQHGSREPLLEESGLSTARVTEIISSYWQAL